MNKMIFVIGCFNKVIDAIDRILNFNEETIQLDLV